jgi:hypothetical protein
MSDGDLVKRLMGYADRVSSGVNETCAEAADRITALTEESAALALQVQRAREEGWNAALEEAAQVVSGMWPREINLWPEEWSDRADDIAAAIRAIRGATEEAGG